MALQLFDDSQNNQTLQPLTQPTITPASLEARRQIALAMMKQGMDYSPIQSPWQGVARVADAIMGGYRANRLDQQELAGRKSAAEGIANAISGAFGGGTSSGAFPSAPSAAANANQPTTNVAGGAGGSAPDMSGNDIYSGFMGTIKNGITNPNALAAVAATGKAESSYDPSKAFGSWSDPSESGQAGTSGGIMSWRGPRFQAMRSYAAANGGDPNAPSPQLQAQFFLQENPGLINELNGAKTPAQAQQLMNNAWKFAGYDQPGGEAARRIALANNFAQQFVGSPAAAAANAVASGELPQTAPIPTPNPVQVASLDPSAGMGQIPPQASAADPGMLAAANAPPPPPPDATGAGNPMLLPQAPIPQPSPLSGGPNGAAPISPLGQQLLMAPHALSGDGGVLPPMASPPSGAAAVAAAMNSPAAASGGASVPSSPGAANVAAAMNGGGPSNLPVMAGGSADAVSPLGAMGGNGRMGMDPSQISAISSAMANPWMSDGQQQLLGSVLSSRLTPHKIEMVPLGDGSTAEIDSITGQQVGVVRGVRPPVSLGYDQRLVDPATGQQIGGGPANGQLPFRFMTQQEKQANGLPLDTPIQIGPDGKMVSNGVTVNTGTPQSQYSDEMAKGLSGPHLALENGVEAAQEQQRDIHAMQAAVQQIQQNGGTTGLLAPEIAKLQSAINTGANLLGVDQPFDISDKEFLTKFNRQIAGAQAKSAAGARVTNFELKNFLAANPGLEMSPQGNERLLGIQNQILQRNIDLGQALRASTAQAVSQGRKVNPAENEQLIRDYDAQHHIVDPITNQDLTKDVKLKDVAQLSTPSVGTGRPRASNANGDTVEWDGTNWVPVK